MNNLTIGERSFTARNAQQGRNTPATWIYLDPTSPLGNDTITAIAKYADGESKADRTIVTVTHSDIVESAGLPVQPYYPAKARIEYTFDKNMPLVARAAFEAEVAAVLASAPIKGAVTNNTPVL